MLSNGTGTKKEYKEIWARRAVSIAFVIYTSDAVVLIFLNLCRCFQWTLMKMMKLWLRLWMECTTPTPLFRTQLLLSKIKEFDILLFRQFGTRITQIKRIFEEHVLHHMFPWIVTNDRFKWTLFLQESHNIVHSNIIFGMIHQFVFPFFDDVFTFDLLLRLSSITIIRQYTAVATFLVSRTVSILEKKRINQGTNNKKCSTRWCFKEETTKITHTWS